MEKWLQLLIGGITALGLVAVGRAIVTGLAMSRRPAHQDTPLSEHPPASMSEIPPSGE
jgi:hypothetical protein